MVIKWTFILKINSISVYNSSVNKYSDELGWSAAWLLRATNDSAYINHVEKHYKEFSLTKNLGFSWY
jgi:hypothetical protein